MHNGTMVKRHIVVEQLCKGSKFFSVGQLAGKQQECHLLKTKAFLLEKRFYKLAELVTTIEEFAIGRMKLTILTALVAHHITNVGETHKHTRAIFIAQATLNTILGKQFIVNLAGTLYLVTKLINQILFLHTFAKTYLL